MKHSFLLAMAIAASLAFAPFSPARAQTALTAGNVKSFIDTLPDLKAFSDTLEQSGKSDTLSEAFQANAAAGDFSPYTTGVSALKEKFPADYAQLGTLVAKHGFSSQEDWAETGNSVMKAYMAIKMEGEGGKAAAAMQAMSPEMLDKLPPQARAQIEASKKLMASAAAVPASDKDAMRPYVGQFEDWAKKAGEEESAKHPQAMQMTDEQKAAISGALSKMIPAK
jgi:hypothetical protein